MSTLEALVGQCGKWGVDRLLVQGAGGNISFKDSGHMWIKGSGTWIARADKENIFTKVDLDAYRIELQNGNFAHTPSPLEGYTLRPSIEVSLHAVLPHRFVVHFHSVEALALLVQRSAKSLFDTQKLRELGWAYMGYSKPGATLTQALISTMADFSGQDLRAVFLANHGVVVGGETLSEVEAELQRVREFCRVRLPKVPDFDSQVVYGSRLSPFSGHSALKRPAFFENLLNIWSYCPDHVVFLGPYPQSESPHSTLDQKASELPMASNGQSLWATRDLNLPEQQQLLCFLDVMTRVEDFTQVNTLNPSQVMELLNWDAEKHRKSLGDSK